MNLTIARRSDETDLLYQPDEVELKTIDPHNKGIWISTHDAHAFAIASDTCIGLSTVATQAGDEVWQFYKARLALIARQTVDGYKIIGTARLLSDNQITHPNPYHDENMKTRLEGFGYIACH